MPIPNQDLNNQINQIIQFDETNSKKIIALKKFISSNIMLSFIIIFILTEALNFIDTIVSSFASNTITTSLVFEVILSAITTVLFPSLIIAYLIKLRIRVKKDEFGKNGVQPLTKSLMVFRSYMKILLIFVVVLNLINGISYYNLINMFNDPTMAQTLINLGITKEYAAYARIAGANMLFKGVFYAIFAFAFLRASKMMFIDIIMPQQENKLYDFYVVSGSLLIYAICLLVGLILVLCGISTPLSDVSPGTFNVYPDIFYIFEIVSLIILILFGATLPIFIRRILVSNQGNIQNPLFDNNQIYTVNLNENPDDIKY